MAKFKVGDVVVRKEGTGSENSHHRCVRYEPVTVVSVDGEYIGFHGDDGGLGWLASAYVLHQSSPQTDNAVIEAIKTLAAAGFKVTLEPI